MPVDLSVLQAVEQAASAKEDGSAYTADSWKSLQDALEAAGRVVSNPNATQDGVDAATEAVATALAGLVLKPADPPKEVIKEVVKEVVKEVPGKEVVKEVPGKGVPAATTAKVKLAQSQLTLVKKKSAKISAGVYFSGSHPSYWDALTWKSSNPKVAKVNQNGKITGVKKGTATITVTTKAIDAKGKQVSAKLKVKVVTKKPKSKVTKVSASVPKSMKLGQVVYITGKYSSSKAAGVKVSYSTSKYHRVVVDKAGQLVAKSKGKDTLTVKAGKKVKKYQVIVK
jgi:hypothetical protein